MAAVDVVQLGSDDDAREALDYVRSEALKQPCFAVCSVEAREFSVAGIPGAEGVQLTPLTEPPPDAPPRSRPSASGSPTVRASTW